MTITEAWIEASKQFVFTPEYLAVVKKLPQRLNDHGKLEIDWAMTQEDTAALTYFGIWAYAPGYDPTTTTWQPTNTTGEATLDESTVPICR